MRSPMLMWSDGQRRGRAAVAHRRSVLCVAGLLVLWATSAAEAQRAGGVHKPWFEDTTLQQRKAARELFRDGNRLLQVPSFARAAETYKRAIAMWGHPAFYYNLVIAQLSLVRPVDAYASVNQALRYGVDALGEDKYQQALNYKQRLEDRLAKVVIACDEPGAEVTLDGQRIFVGPGTHEQVLLPGNHEVIARKPGRTTETRRLVLSAGERVEVALVLGFPDRVGTERYVASWIPWTILGAGAALLGSAGYMDWRSSRELDGFDRDFDAMCRRGCIERQVPELASRLRSAESRKRATLGLYVAGGVVVVGSAVFAYLNRERVVRTRVKRESLSVTPLVTPDAVGVAAGVRF